jgi:hypothetical protein
MYPADDIREIQELSFINEATGKDERVQLISIGYIMELEEEGEYPHHLNSIVVKAILTGFHSTVVQNCLTGTEAVSLLPQTTFVKCKTYVHRVWRKERCSVR